MDQQGNGVEIRIRKQDPLGRWRLLIADPRSGLALRVSITLAGSHEGSSGMELERDDHHDSPLLSFFQLMTSFDPESLRLTLQADSDPGFAISDLDLQ